MRAILYATLLLLAFGAMFVTMAILTAMVMP